MYQIHCHFSYSFVLTIYQYEQNQYEQILPVCYDVSRNALGIRFLPALLKPSTRPPGQLGGSYHIHSSVWPAVGEVYCCKKCCHWPGIHKIPSSRASPPCPHARAYASSSLLAMCNKPIKVCRFRGFNLCQFTVMSNVEHV